MLPKAEMGEYVQGRERSLGLWEAVIAVVRTA